ncbi:MAG: acetylornithine deacetylase [Proteobacteria bacterium]|nr:acetylornithine deacetylase [Pseudomonadota bacterium]
MPVIPTIPEMVRNLIATPSVSSTLPQYDLSNRDVVNLLAEWLEALGFRIRVSPIPSAPGKVNLIAILGSGDRGLILSGHTDTVPHDEHRWDSDPFTLKEQDGRWYGLGTSDMKSFFALVIEAVAPLADRPMKHPLIVLATADEESSMSGIRQLQREDIAHAAYAVIGEPTSLVPITHHKGIMLLKASITGHSGHSSDPERFASALDGCALVINELIRFKGELRASHSDMRFAVSYPTLNLGCIHGGKNPNRICDEVEISLDVRVLPGMDNETVFRQLKTRLESLRQPGLVHELQLLHEPVSPFANEGQQLTRTLTAATGSAPQAVAFGTEAPFLNALDIETVVIGPGSIDQAHQPNEYIELSQLKPTVGIIRDLVSQYCL